MTANDDTSPDGENGTGAGRQNWEFSNEGIESKEYPDQDVGLCFVNLGEQMHEGVTAQVAGVDYDDEPPVVELRLSIANGVTVCLSTDEARRLAADLEGAARVEYSE